MKCNYKESRQGVDELKALFLLDVAGKAGNVKNLNHRVCAMKNPDHFASARRSVRGSLRHTSQAFLKPREWSDCHSALKACMSLWVVSKDLQLKCNFSDGYARKNPSCWSLGCS